MGVDAEDPIYRRDSVGAAGLLHSFYEGISESQKSAARTLTSRNRGARIFHKHPDRAAAADERFEKEFAASHRPFWATRAYFLGRNLGSLFNLAGKLGLD